MLHVLATHQHWRSTAIVAAPCHRRPRRCWGIFARLHFQSGRHGALARADNRQDYICSRVALTRTHATILSHISHSPTFRSLDSALITRYRSPARFFFDVKWLATESVLLIEFILALSSPIQTGTRRIAPQHRLKCGTVALRPTEHYVTHLHLFNFAFDTNSKVSDC
jgi:hypothetical protein